MKELLQGKMIHQREEAADKVRRHPRVAESVIKTSSALPRSDWCSDILRRGHALSSEYKGGE